MDSSPISSFYHGKCILVTGFSGFLGKVLVSKLVKSTNAKTIYVLIRDKNGQNYKQRTHNILTNLPFTLDKNSNLNHPVRVVPIKGDLTCPNLGIKEEDIEILRREVSIVFHSAAEVRFNVGLSTNYVQNVEGTANLVKLCRTFNRVDCLVHVSSLYSAGNQSIIEESVQSLKLDYKEIRKCLSTSSNVMDDRLKEMESLFPNSYTLTKALAEDLVQQEAGDIPVAIVRPSIVFVSLKEPAPGWGDTLQGIQGIAISATTGLLQTVNWNYETRFEMVPVDICANLTIASAWYMVEKSSTKLQVINLTTGPFHPEWSFGRFFSVAREFAIAYPSSKQLRPLIKPPRIKRASILFSIEKFIYHSLFAFIIDLLLSILGHKKVLYRHACKLNEGLDHIVFFASHEYQIKTDNYVKLIESMSTVDRQIFNSDLRNLDYLDHIRCVYFGFRRYFLGDDDSNIEASRSRAKIICFAYRSIQIFFFAILGFSFMTIIYRYVFT